MMSRAKKFASPSHVYDVLRPWQREDIVRMYNERVPLTSIAKSIGESLRVVRTFVAMEIQAKRLKEQLDLRKLEREIALAKADYDRRMHARLETVDDSVGIPRGSDRHIYDRRAAEAGSRKLLEAIHRYLEKREAAQQESQSGTV